MSALDGVHSVGCSAHPKPLVRSTPGLAAITDPTWAAAIEAASVMRLPDGASITMCSDDVDHFTLVLSGNLKIRARSDRSEEHTSEIQSLNRSSYAYFCLKTQHY